MTVGMVRTRLTQNLRRNSSAWCTTPRSQALSGARLVALDPLADGVEFSIVLARPLLLDLQLLDRRRVELALALVEGGVALGRPLVDGLVQVLLLLVESDADPVPQAHRARSVRQPPDSNVERGSVRGRR